MQCNLESLESTTRLIKGDNTTDNPVYTKIDNIIKEYVKKDKD